MLRSSASAYPGVCFTQSKRLRAWLPGSSVSYVEAHERSVFELSLQEATNGTDGGVWWVTALFQTRAANGMFGHPTRNAFALVTPTSRFQYDDTYSCMVTRYGPFSKILEYMRIAVEVPCFSHGEIDECSVNP